jgi:hypothetical protein
VWCREKKAAAHWFAGGWRGKTQIDCMDRCSQWPEEERPCPAKVRVERVAGRIVIALSATGQLIALLDKEKRMDVLRMCGLFLDLLTGRFLQAIENIG